MDSITGWVHLQYRYFELSFDLCFALLLYQGYLVLISVWTSTVVHVFSGIKFILLLHMTPFHWTSLALISSGFVHPNQR